MDMMMKRSDCIQFFKDKSYPIPVKSSCVFCPYHSDSYWLEMKKENSKEGKTAIKVDGAIRDSSQRGKRDKLYLHRSLKPLNEVYFQENQLDMFENECEGHCGL